MVRGVPRPTPEMASAGGRLAGVSSAPVPAVAEGAVGAPDVVAGAVVVGAVVAAVVASVVAFDSESPPQPAAPPTATASATVAAARVRRLIRSGPPPRGSAHPPARPG